MWRVHGRGGQCYLQRNDRLKISGDSGAAGPGEM